MERLLFTGAWASGLSACVGWFNARHPGAMGAALFGKVHATLDLVVRAAVN